MGGNKIATMLHRNTNRVTLTLVYAMLECVLIVLLLWNSLFSYLIIKFADFFGLKRPCLWCSRIDHILEPAKFGNSYRSLLCESHAKEVSKLGYCSDHRKLAESKDMCEDCSSSSRSELPEKFAFFPWMKKLGILQTSGGGDKVNENSEVDLKCSCCGVVFDAKLCGHDYHQSKPSLEHLHFIQEENLTLESRIDRKVDEYDHSERNTSCFLSDDGEDEHVIDEKRGVKVGNGEEETESSYLFSVSNCVSSDTAVDDGEKMDVAKEKELELFKQDSCQESTEDESRRQPVLHQTGNVKDEASEIQPRHLDFYIDQEDCHLIPIDLMDVTTAEKRTPKRYGKGEEENCGDEDFVLEFDKVVETKYELIVEETSNLEEEVPLLSGSNTLEQLEAAVVDSEEINENEVSSEDLNDRNAEKEKYDLTALVEETKNSTRDGHDFQGSPLAVGDETESANDQISEEVQGNKVEVVSVEVCQVQGEEVEAVSEKVLLMQFNEVEALSEEVLQVEDDEVEAEVSIGTEIPDQEPIDDIQCGEAAPSYQCTEDDPSTNTVRDNAYVEYGHDHGMEDIVEFKTMLVEISEPMRKYHSSFCSESNEIEEDRVPDTPTSVDSLHSLHKKLSLLERIESGTEDSLNGSMVSSDIEAGDGVPSIEKLKSALVSERKALHALYAELEEERSASAIAANQTMAMINRIQEEKAAMQMEALQYQRMMEEQAEYDQEALQLMNELMVKREKEKTELEKELELYCKKVQDYEAKEKTIILKRRKDGSARTETSSASSSAVEDSDGLSVDLNRDGKEEDRFDNHPESGNQNTPVDAVLYLQDSLANFEEERLSILEQLKLLEEKLFTLGDEDEQHSSDIKNNEHVHEENGNHETHSIIQGNGVANGHHKEINVKHHLQRKNVGAKAKTLLPLFDATDADRENEERDELGEGDDSVALTSAEGGSDLDDKKLATEEIDHVYERLEALEADREFLKHWITSLRKGDKGIELLQEILQHLRDLRSVELRATNIDDGFL